MAKDGNLAQAKANEGNAQDKVKGGKPNVGKPKGGKAGGKATVDKKHDEEGEEMEDGV